MDEGEPSVALNFDYGTYGTTEQLSPKLGAQSQESLKDAAAFDRVTGSSNGELSDSNH